MINQFNQPEHIPILSELFSKMLVISSENNFEPKKSKTNLRSKVKPYFTPDHRQCCPSPSPDENISHMLTVCVALCCYTKQNLENYAMKQKQIYTFKKYAVRMKLCVSSYNIQLVSTSEIGCT